VTGEPRISLVCFGLVGTLAEDAEVTQQSFAEAIATQGVVSGTSAYAHRMTQVHQALGRAPGDVLRLLFPDNEARAQAAELAFGKSLADAVSRVQLRPPAGAREVLEGLAGASCRLGLMTSLPRRILDSVLEMVGWRDLFDVALSGDDVQRACPAPDLALLAMLRVGVGDVRELAVVQGTAPGVACGRRAGASLAVGLLTGPHSEARLRSAGATHIIGSIADLPAIMASATGGGASGDPAARRDAEAPDLGVAAARGVAVNIPSQGPLEHRS
jgi:phosphoglycolate phosphatase